MRDIINSVVTINFLENIIIYLIVCTKQCEGIWPPSYKINLTHEEVFVIGESSNDDDAVDIFDVKDEMIQKSELKRFDLERDFKKFSRLHKMMLKQNYKKRNIEESIYNMKLIKKPTELPYEEEPVPWKAGLVRSSNNKMDKAEKREENKTQVEEYDYLAMKEEYEKSIQVEKTSNNTLNFTNVEEEEEGFKESMKSLVKSKKEKLNCSSEEQKGIGLYAAKCILQDLTNPKTSSSKRMALFRRIGTIIMIWVFVYLMVAIPCWCQRGWCCCCFQCKFCQPKERIDFAKKFLMDNPPGVYHDENNKKITYSATSYEKYLQTKLEKALMKI